MHNTIKSTIVILWIFTSNMTNADAICNDGWRSTSEGSGTCSWHGGVDQWKPDGTYWFGGYGIINKLNSARKYIPGPGTSVPGRILDWLSDDN
jgi:hypothetical protein